MFKSKFSIEKITKTKSGLMGRTYERTMFNVVYKGVALNAFLTEQEAQECIDDVASMREDAEWAFDKSLREMGFGIPA